MILDTQARFASAQALSATGNSTDTVDLGADRNIGIGKPMALVIAVTTIDATSGDETYSCVLQADDNSAFSSAATVMTVAVPRTIGNGKLAYAILPPDTSTERYQRLAWTLGGTTPAITYSAYLVAADALQNDQYFPLGYTIS